MPELPEVETIRKGLEKYLVGKKIKEVEVRDSKLFQGDKFHPTGAIVSGVRRFGKGLVIDLDNGYSIVAHIKLTGQFIYEGKETKELVPDMKLVAPVPSKFTRAIFHLEGGATLFFNDIRRFAWMRFIKTTEVKTLPFFKEMGPEPFKDLKFEYFKTVLQKSTGAIKSTLMDQKKIGGVGNIYANDALNLAKIDPKRSGKSLNDLEIKKLYEAVETVLKTGLKYGGATEINYVNVLGQAGKYQNHFLAYGRAGEKCKQCGKGIIKKIRIAGRGTYFCPVCQK